MVFAFFSALFHIYLAHLIVGLSNVTVYLVCDFSIVATCPSIQLPALLFVCVLFVLYLFFVFFWMNQSRNKGEGWSTAN